jgi:hypothetical protein
MTLSEESKMTPTLNPHEAAPEALKAMAALESAVQRGGLDRSLD